MKALTLRQPWATLIAVGAKQVETRSWHPKENPGVIAIASSKSRLSGYALALSHTAPFSEVLPRDLPTGAILAVARLARFERTEDVDGISDLERAFGDYRPRRWAWHIDAVEALNEPIPIPSWKPGEKKDFRLGLWSVPKKLITPELTEALLKVQGR